MNARTKNTDFQDASCETDKNFKGSQLTNIR